MASLTAVLSYLDVLLRGAILAAQALAIGGIAAFALLMLGPAGRRKPQDGLPRGDHTLTARMLHGMGAMARAAAAVAGQSRVESGLVAGAGSDRVLLLLYRES